MDQSTSGPAPAAPTTSNIWPWLGPVIAVVVVLIIISIVGIWFCRRKRQPEKGGPRRQRRSSVVANIPAIARPVIPGRLVSNSETEPGKQAQKVAKRIAKADSSESSAELLADFSVRPARNPFLDSSDPFDDGDAKKDAPLNISATSSGSGSTSKLSSKSASSRLSSNPILSSHAPSEVSDSVVTSNKPTSNTSRNSSKPSAATTSNKTAANASYQETSACDTATLPSKRNAPYGMLADTASSCSSASYKRGKKKRSRSSSAGSASGGRSAKSAGTTSAPSTIKTAGSPRDSNTPWSAKETSGGAVEASSRLSNKSNGSRKSTGKKSHKRHGRHEYGHSIGGAVFEATPSGFSEGALSETMPELVVEMVESSTGGGSNSAGSAGGPRSRAVLADWPGPMGGMGAGPGGPMSRKGRLIHRVKGQEMEKAPRPKKRSKKTSKKSSKKSSKNNKRRKSGGSRKRAHGKTSKKDKDKKRDKDKKEKEREEQAAVSESRREDGTYTAGLDEDGPVENPRSAGEDLLCEDFSIPAVWGV